MSREKTMYTLAQFKRELQNGEIKGLELIERRGEPLKDTCVVPIYKVHSNSFTLNRDGVESWVWFPPASLFEYDGEYMRMYSSGTRELNDLEKQVMLNWQRIENSPEYEERTRVDMLTDGSSTYYQKKRYFENSPCPYLFSEQNNKRYDPVKKVVYDPKVKGICALCYRVYK